MRWLGLMVCLASACTTLGLGACGSFGADESTAKPVSDAATATPEADAIATDAKDGGGSPCTGDAAFCADFETVDPRSTMAQPTATEPLFLQTVEIAPGDRGGHALRIEVTDNTTDLSVDIGAFRTALAAAPFSFTSATLRLAVYAETTDFDFARLAAFAVRKDSGFYRGFGLATYPHEGGEGDVGFKGNSDEETDEYIVPDRTWHEAKVVLTRGTSGMSSRTFLDGVLIGDDAQDFDLSAGTLSLAFGVFDASMSSSPKLIVYLDDIVVTLD